MAKCGGSKKGGKKGKGSKDCKLLVLSENGCGQVARGSTEVGPLFV